MRFPSPSFGTSLRTRVLLGAALLLIFVISAVAVLPANWLLRLNTPHAPIQWVGAQGTLWQGQAMLAVGHAGFERSVPAPLQWHTEWTPSPQLTLRHPWLSHPVTVQPSWQGLIISGARLQIPARLLSSLDRRLAMLEPGGQVTVQWPRGLLPYSASSPSDLELTLQWLNASTSLSHVAPIGSYTLAIKLETRDQAHLQLSTVSGPILAQGSGTYSVSKGLSGTLQVGLDAQTQGADKVSLTELLALLGPSQHGQTVIRLP